MTQSLMTRLNNEILYLYLFCKHFHKFFFLHKPLCEKYKSHTLRIFGWYICKSCLLLYLGFFLTLTTLIIVSPNIKLNRYFVLFCCGFILTLLVSYPPVYSKFRNLTKNIIRFYDGIFMSAGFYIAFKISIVLGILSILTFIVVRNYYNRKRTGERICLGCTQLSDKTTCEGYKLQKEALLKIDEEYSQIRTKNIIKKERKNKLC